LTRVKQIAGDVPQVHEEDGVKQVEKLIQYRICDADIAFTMRNRAAEETA